MDSWRLKSRVQTSMDIEVSIEKVSDAMNIEVEKSNRDSWRPNEKVHRI